MLDFPYKPMHDHVCNQCGIVIIKKCITIDCEDEKELCLDCKNKNEKNKEIKC